MMYLVFMSIVNAYSLIIAYISSLLMLEEAGVTYRTQTGETEVLEKIFISGGANTVRLRLWVNPVGGNYYIN
jgi:arabinogalactan endo-1,4-beta-galactosidase